MKLNSDLVELFELFKKNNFKLYVIGGAVRDYLLGRKIEDYDLTTSATPSQMIKILEGYKLDIFQSKLGSIKVHINKKVYEITTFRKEVGVKELRYPNEIIFINNLEEDVLRRDFTINTLAYNPTDGIIDYLNGVNDLETKQIRFVKDTLLSINEDPIRLIRALRFSLSLGFWIDSNDLDIFYQNANLVSKLSRIKYDELFKLLKMNGCKKFILKHFNIYKQVYPELDNDDFIKILESELEEDLLIYVVAFYIDDLLLYLNKKDKLIMNGLKSIDVNNDDLYYTKLFMIQFKNVLDVILILVKYLKNDSSKFINNVILIKKEKQCLSVNELKITYLDLEKLNINKKYYTKVFNYLLELVLEDNTLNSYDQLIALIKNIKLDY